MSSQPAEAPVPSTVDTRFGIFGVRAEDIVTFPDGLPGFETCHRFVLLSAEALAPFRCLQALDPPGPSFLAVDPMAILPQYRTALSADDQLRLGADADGLVWLALITLDEDRTTVNLRAPLVINAARMVGYQVMPHRSCYPVNHPLELE